MTIPPVTSSANNHTNPVSIITTTQPINLHCMEPHPLPAASTSTPGSLPMTKQGLNRVKEKLQNIGQFVSERSSGWVDGASGKIMERKYSIHKSSKGDDKQFVRYSSCRILLHTFFRIQWKCQMLYHSSYLPAAIYHHFHLLLPSYRRRYACMCTHTHTHTCTHTCKHTHSPKHIHIFC